MDDDYELEDEYAPRILWGRLAFFLLALILVFFAGRACAPNGVPQSEFQAERDKAFELASENTVLQQRLDARENAEQATGGKKNSGGKNKGEAAEAGEEETNETTGGEEIPEGGKTYTVQPNDTLTTIAEEFYGDPTMFDLIVDANNLTEDTPLRVGQELVIPPND